jgi:uncharacterized protein
MGPKLPFRRFDWIAPSLAVIAAAWIPSATWERVKTKPKDSVIQVTGSAKRRIISDAIEWSADVVARDVERVAAYRKLHDDVAKTVDFLVARGIKREEIRVLSASVMALTRTEVVGVGDERIERAVPDGFVAEQRVTVSSGDVAAVEKTSREVTELLEGGIEVSSGTPEYFYTGLGELKIEMLAEASKDARTRADNMVESAGGGRIARLRGADMGVINVNPANSTSTSWDGNNDTTSLHKDIITIVHANFELANE